MNKEKLNLVEESIKKCQLCKGLLKLNCNTISLGRNTNILFVGESPAKNGWILSKKAFYSPDNKLLPTGKVLNELLKIINLTIDDITFTEACKCHIRDRKFIKEASANCSQFLEEQIEGLNSRIIIPLGEHPTRILISQNFKNFKDVVGKVFYKKINEKDVLIIPIYHPSPINPKGYKDNIPIFRKIKTYLKD